MGGSISGPVIQLFNTLFYSSGLITELCKIFDNTKSTRTPTSFFVLKILLVIPRSLSSFHNPMNLLISLGKWNLTLEFSYPRTCYPRTCYLCCLFTSFLYSSEKFFSFLHQGSAHLLLPLFDTVVFVAIVFFVLDFNFIYCFNVSDLYVSSYPASW